jgi:hypothetical protein
MLFGMSFAFRASTEQGSPGLFRAFFASSEFIDDGFIERGFRRKILKSSLTFRSVSRQLDFFAR